MTTPHGSAPGAFGMTQPCRPTALVRLIYSEWLSAISRGQPFNKASSAIDPFDQSSGKRLIGIVSSLADSRASASARNGPCSMVRRIIVRTNGCSSLICQNRDGGQQQLHVPALHLLLCPQAERVHPDARDDPRKVRAICYPLARQ